MRYYLIAGEASGDLHASHLMKQLLEQDPEVHFRYYGGDAMAAVGGELVCHYRQLAYMGFYQVITHLPTILSGMKRCKADIQAFAPDVVILVDYPGFNLGIAKWVKQHLPNTRVAYYISPKIWAWKSWRLKAIRRDVDLMLSILPFEVAWYKERGYEVEYVGNPTVDELYPLRTKSVESAAATGTAESAELPLIALVPGSRRAEVRDNLRVMLEATHGMGRRVITGAPGLTPEFYQEVLHNMGNPSDVEVVFGQTHALMQQARVAAVTSGTATLETAYLRCPQVVCYNFKGGMLVYNIMKLALKSIRYVSLVNLLIYGISADKHLPDERHAAVVELLGPYLTANTLRQELQKLLPLNSSARMSMLKQYDVMAHNLGEPGAPRRAAARIIALLRNSK